ncbi:MAG: helix-turn-helix domain-containing protein [Isosphaera sp.]|nr:helix-turn-helix domain-containing protein [Isosphaera sp.]
MVVRALTAAERQALVRGLKSADGFTVRRSQIVPASAAGDGPAAIGRAVGLTVRDAVRAFHADGLGCLTRKPPVAKTPAAAWGRRHDPDLKDLLHRRPREFGKPTTLWTLALVADVCHAKGVGAPGAHGRGDAAGPQAVGDRVDAGEARDHRPGPRVRQEKRPGTG